MVFSTSIFLFGFLPLTLLGYFLIQHKLRNGFLLLMSLLFYAWGEPKFVFVMISSIVLIYGASWLVEYTRNSGTFTRRFILFISLSINLSLLFFFKYYDFFISNINAVSGSDLPLKHLVLPIGISFFTFQGMSYIIDLYWGKIQIQKNPLKIALYIALFPPLIAGPIIRYSDLNEQIDNRTVTVDDFAYGAKRFITGLAKKVIIANTFAIWADTAFSMDPASLSVALAWAGIVSYTLQIYFDFSGYSDMAIGLGRMFGFRILENFNYPYISRSVQEFWRRWHISLSSWFRDYVYIPMGGSRTGNQYVNLVVVWFLTGMWHGAAWNFIFWGLWHLIFLLLERFGKKLSLPFTIPSPIKWGYTMLAIMLGWVLFRAPDLTHAVQYTGSMFGLYGNNSIDNLAKLFFSEHLILLPLACLCATPVLGKLFKSEEGISQVLTPLLLALLFILSISYIVNTSYNPFIYFNF